MRMASCHDDRKHYCRGLCNSCYNTLNKQRHRINPPIATCHPEKENVGRGLCYACYAELRKSPDYQRVRTKGRAKCINHPDKVVEGRGLCKSCYSAWWRKNNPEKHANQKKKDKLAVYGLSVIDFDKLLASQNNQCAICAKEFTSARDTQVDHCHETNVVRGILCFTCNKALGMFGDNVSGIQKALEYLKMAEIGIIIADPERGPRVLHATRNDANDKPAD